MTQWKVSNTGYRYPIADNDAQRIELLRDYNLFSMDENPELTSIIKLVANHFDIKMVSITLLDEDTQYIKSPLGLPKHCMTERDVSICNYTIHHGELLVVPDLSADARFANNPVVASDIGLRFYAGAPIKIHHPHTKTQQEDKVGADDKTDTLTIGVLCVVSHQTNNQFNESHCQDLNTFAAMCASIINKNIQQEKARVSSYKKSLFLGNISHEIRTSMNSVLGMVEMMHETALDSEQTQYLSHIETASENLITVINNMLDLSKTEAGGIQLNCRSIDLNALCQDVINHLTVKAHKKHIDLTYLFDEKLCPQFVTDANRLKQVLQTLVNNAINFTPRSGKVSLIIASALHCRQLMQTTPHNKNTANIDKTLVNSDICVIVRDTGIGIRPESLSVMFDAYQHADKLTHRLYGGTGLGLSVCRVLVESMGGHIWAESVVGQGTDFFIRLPNIHLTNNLTSTELSHTNDTGLVTGLNVTDLNVTDLNDGSLSGVNSDHDQPSSTKPTGHTKLDIDDANHERHQTDIQPLDSQLAEKITQNTSLTGHILLVEDDKSNALVAIKNLESWQHQVTHVTNGQQALTIIANTPKQFDLILMDHHMPVMDGLTTMVRLLEKFDSSELPPIIALTANANKKDKPKYLKYGMQDYVAKPYKKTHLQKVIQKWLATNKT